LLLIKSAVKLAIYRFTLACDAVFLIGGVMAQLDYNVWRTGEEVLPFALFLI
jgi:hypothetical protein